MTFPRKLLHGDEDVLAETRLSSSLLVKPAVVALVVIGGASAVFVEWSSAPAVVGIVLLGVALCGVGYFLSRLFRWRSTEFVVTSRRVVYRSGVLRRFGREIPLSSVEHVEFSQSLFQRLLRKGQLIVGSAGAHDDDPFRDIPRPQQIQGMVNRAIDESRRRDTVSVDNACHVSITDEIKRLEDLQRRGVITAAEFSGLKSDLIEDESPAHDHDEGSRY